MFDRETLDRVRSQGDLVSIVQEHVGLRASGSEWRGCCPFHQEKTPSFYVVPDKHLFHCFGCGQGGDVIDFLQLIAGMDFGEAVNEVAERSGISLVDNSDHRPARKSLYEVAAFCQRWFASQLGAASDYLSRRGYSQETAESWGLGYAPESWEALHNHLLRNYVPLEAALSVGVLVPSNSQRAPHDRFRGRLTFPIHDAQGRVIGFAGRDLTGKHDTPKYVNTPEGALYQKGQVLYGLDRSLAGIRKAASIIVCEGYTDVHALHEAGMKNAVATCGTALTETQAKRIARLAKTVLLAGDPDRPGMAAMVKHLPALSKAGVEVLRVPLPMDPADTWREHGPEGLSRFVEQARPFLPEAIQLVSESHDHTPQGREQAALELQPILSAFGGVARERAVRDAATILGTPEAKLRALAGRPEQPYGEERTLPTELDPATSSVCWVMLHHPEYREEVVAHASPSWFPRAVQPFMEELLTGTDVASALSVVDPSVQVALRALAVESTRYGRGQVERVLYEGVARAELGYIDGTMGSAHNGVRFELQKRRLYLREYILGFALAKQ